MWDFGQLSQADRLLDKIVYEGDDISCNTCICAVNNTSSAVINSIVKKMTPVGYIIDKEMEIINAEEYANGGNADLQQVGEKKHPVYKYNGIVLFNLSEQIFNHVGCARVIINSTKAQEIKIITSTHQSLLAGYFEAGKLFILSTKPEENSYPAPNIINGIAAGVLTLSEQANIHCVVYNAIEFDYGASLEVMEALVSAISDLLKLDVKKAAASAIDLYQLSNAELDHLYS